MIVNINPITVEGITTDKAIVNMSIGDNSVAISLYPAIEVSGQWQKIEGAPVLPVVGLDSDTDIATMLAGIEPDVQILVAGRGI